jgi:hypothetical protein
VKLLDADRESEQLKENRAELARASSWLWDICSFKLSVPRNHDECVSLSGGSRKRSSGIFKYMSVRENIIHGAQFNAFLFPLSFVFNELLRLNSADELTPRTKRFTRSLPEARMVGI